MAGNSYQTAWDNVSSFVSAGQDLVNTVNQINAQKKQDENIEWQKNQITNEFDFQKYWADKQFEYQKMMNQLTMNREDNAIQRRASDLVAAGLNPNLAVGQPASSQGFGGAGSVGVIGTNLGQRHVAKMDSSAFLDARMRLAQMGQIYAQNELLDSQRQYYESLSGKVDAETAAIPDTQNYLRANASSLSAKANQLRHDLNISRERGIRTNDNGNYALIQQVLDTLRTRISSNAPLFDVSSPASLDDFVSSFSNFLDKIPNFDIGHVSNALDSAISKALENYTSEWKADYDKNRDDYLSRLMNGVDTDSKSFWENVWTVFKNQFKRVKK